MRLRSQKNAGASPHQNAPSPRQPQSPARVPSAYQTAYNRGIVLGPDGHFDHFVRILSASHIQTGYWRFSSDEDDQRAYARGFSTPEDVLLEQDRSEESYSEISIRWVRGADDINLSLPLAGSAAQHLHTIYEVRQILGMSMSLRGQIPVYPISQNTRLKKYWENKARQQLGPFRFALTAASPLGSSTSNGESLSSSSTQTGLGAQSSRSMRHDNYLADHEKRGQGAPAASGRANSTSRPRRPTISPITPERVPELVTAAHSSIRPRRPTVSPITPEWDPEPVTAPSELGRAHDSSSLRRPTVSPITPERIPDSVTAPSALGRVHNSSRARRPTVSPITPERIPEPVTAPVDMNVTSLRLSNTAPNANTHQYHSPYPGLAPSPGTSLGRSTSDAHAPFTPVTGISSLRQPPSPYVSPYARPVSISISPRHDSNANESPPHTSELRPPNNPTLLGEHAQHSPLLSDLRLTSARNNTVPAASPSAAFRPTADTLQSTSSTDRASNLETLLVDQSTQRRSSVEATPVVTLEDLSTDGLVCGDESTSSAPAASPNGIQDTIELGQTHHEGEARVGSGTISPNSTRLSPHASELYSGLPCMDCGEEEGHKWDCHIGSKHLESTSLKSKLTRIQISRQ